LGLGAAGGGLLSLATGRSVVLGHERNNGWILALECPHALSLSDEPGRLWGELIAPMAAARQPQPDPHAACCFLLLLGANPLRRGRTVSCSV